jgi:GMP synthase (glutamine-hydrolysing)
MRDMKTALAVRHVHFEHLGALEPLLAAAGYVVRYVEAPTADWKSEKSPDLLVLLGGPISVNDHVDYPFLVGELAFVKQHLQEGRATLGLCLGAQLMARALGQRVFAMGHKEVGWSALAPTPAGSAHPLRHLLYESLPVLHFHGETFDLPEGAELLASTALCQHQAFSLGSRALGLQFHPEVTRRAARELVGGAHGRAGAAEALDPRAAAAERRAGSAAVGAAAGLCQRVAGGALGSSARLSTAAKRTPAFCSCSTTTGQLRLS